MREPDGSSLHRILCPIVAACLVGACTGTERAPSEPDDGPVVAPEVTLRVKLPRGDLPFRNDSTSIAHGEEVLLWWDTEGPPESCTASGAWAGSSPRARGGKSRTGSLSGPGEYGFEVTCENPAGTASDRVEVRVAAPGERPPRSNRPDQVRGHQVKVLYVLPADGEGRDLDTGGWLAFDVAAFQAWLASETRSDRYPEGRRFRMDRFEGELDIARIRLHQTGDELAGKQRGELLPLISNRIDEVSLPRAERKYLVYFDGPRGGGFGGEDALVGFDSTVPIELVAATSPMAVHMLAHTLDVVGDDAPHVVDAENTGHVDDSHFDLMHRSIGLYQLGVVLDHGRDDYYNESRLPDGVTNLAKSPYLTDGSDGGG